MLDENPFAFFFHRAVLAKAFVGLNDPQSALKQFEDVQRRVDADGTGLDFTIFTQLYHSFAEYCLLLGDVAQARTRAVQLREYAAPAPIGIIWRWRMVCWPGLPLRPVMSMRPGPNSTSPL